MGSKSLERVRAPRRRLRRPRTRRVRAGAAAGRLRLRRPRRRPARRCSTSCGIERAVLAGASMGAHTIARLALSRPDRVAAARVHHPGVRARARRGPGRAGTASPRACAAGGIEGFVQAYGLTPHPGDVARHRRARHPPAPGAARAPRRGRRRAAGGAALAAVRVARRPRRASAARSIVVASRDEADPGHPFARRRALGRGARRRAAAHGGARASHRSRGRAASSPSSSPISRVPSGPLRSVPSRGFPNVARGSSERRE